MLNLRASARVALDLAKAEIEWPTFIGNLARLPVLPDGFPMPSGGTVLVEIGFEESGGYTLRAASHFELDHEIAIGGLKLGRRFFFEFSTAVAANALAEVLSGRAPRLTGAIKLGADIQLRPLPLGGPLQLHVGGADNWLHVELDVEVDTEGALRLRAEVAEGEFQLDVLVPGGSRESPLLSAMLSDIEIAIDAGGAFGGETVSAGISCNGSVAVNPVVLTSDTPFAFQWQQLFSSLLHPAHVDCRLALDVSSESVRATLSLHGAEIELKPFASLAGLASGVSGQQSANEFPIELPLRFSLMRVSVGIARDLAQSEFSLTTMFAVGEIETTSTIKVTGGEFRIRIEGLEIPLALPRFPFTKQEFDERYGHPEIIEEQLAGAACPLPDVAIADPELASLCKRLRAQRFLLRSFDAVPQAAKAAGHEMNVDALARYKKWLEIFIGSLDIATAVAGKSGDTASFRITERVIARLARENVPVAVRNKLVSIKARYIGTQIFWNALRSRLTPRQFQQHVAGITQHAQIRGASMLASIDGTDHIIIENATVAIDHLEFAVPFSSPNNVRVDGAVKFTAFSEPLGSIEIELEAGVSADMIYLSLKSADGRVKIPGVGRYTGGSIRFSQFLIGFGYTKRSLALAFAGEVVLPEQLVSDLDTSSVSVLGIRLPVQTRLTFRLDLVPVPAPEVAIIVPVFQFNLDLRRPGVPAIADPFRCAPEWDGLQFIVKDHFRFALKHIAFSPVFGFLPSLNWVLNGDLVVGDENYGLAIVIDEWMQIDAFWTPSTFKIALPGFSDDTPFVNDCCVDLRVAGFGIHFHLQRPFPSVSPLALPELFALLSDPGNYPINPRGELANCLRLTIRNTGISLPENLLALFPALRVVTGPAVTETINLGTFITLTQKIARVVAPVLKTVIARVRATANDPQALARSFALPKVQPRDLLRLLPAQLQRFETQASFAGFAGRAVVVLLPIKDARLALRARGQPAPMALEPQGISPGETFTPGALLNFQPRLPDLNAPPPPSPAALLADPVFDAFSEADLNIPPLTQSGDGVLVGARLGVLGVQQIDFIGYVASNGSFALVAALNQAPLNLRVAGIDVPLPFAASVNGRLTLKGKAGPEGVHGSLSAQGAAEWKILPGMIEAAIVKATLTLASDASFTLRGNLALALFGGRVKLNGSIDVAPVSAAVSGKVILDEGPLHLDLGGTGTLGPLHLLPGGKHAGARIDVTCAGKASLFGQNFADARARLIGERLELQGRWKLQNWQLFGTPAVLRGDLALQGVVWFPPTAPALRLEGQGYIELGWNPQAKARTPLDVKIEGSGQIESGPAGTALRAHGTLFWQGRNWASGTLRATPESLQLAGHTTFTLEIPPKPAPLLPLMPRLVLRLDVHGSFELDGFGVITACDFEGHWLLGAKLNESSEQLFTLAADSRKFQSSADTELVHFSGVNLIAGGTSLPIPVYKYNEESDIWMKIGKAGDDQALSFSAAPDKQKTLKLRKAELRAGRVTIGGPEVPELHDRDLVDNPPLLSIYPLIRASETLTVAWPFASAFGVSLGFHGGDIVVKLQVGSSLFVYRLSDGSNRG